MKMVLLNIDKFVAANSLKEATNPILMDRGFIPTVDGILSFDIFGRTTTERKRNFAYINLNTHLLQPLAYKTLLRIDKRVADIIAGTKYFKLDKNGELVEAEDGNTGAEWLYSVWNKLKFKMNDSSVRTKRIQFLKAHERDELFQSKAILIPAFYRDINLQASNKRKPSVHVVNQLYCRLMRLANMLTQGGFAFSMHTSRFQMQNTLVEIYDEFKARCEKKRGLIRQNLLGKSVDYGARLVISATKFTANKPSDMMVTYERTGIPLGHCISLFSPFFVGWIQEFFRSEFESTGNKYPIYMAKTKEVVYKEIKDPMVQFNDHEIEKMLDKFSHSPEDRFNPIYIELTDGTTAPIRFRGFELGKSDEQATKEAEERGNRNMTLTDLMYLCAADVLKDKHVYLTRYPMTDYMGTFPTKIAVLSTVDTVRMQYGDKVYENYPKVEPNLPKQDIGKRFSEVVNLQNTYLSSMGGKQNCYLPIAI